MCYFLLFYYVDISKKVLGFKTVMRENKNSLRGVNRRHCEYSGFLQPAAFFCNWSFVKTAFITVHFSQSGGFVFHIMKPHQSQYQMFSCSHFQQIVVSVTTFQRPTVGIITACPTGLIKLL